jgi:hypothetical protein
MRKHSLGADHQNPSHCKARFKMTNPKDSTAGLGRRSFLLKAATSAVVVTANRSVMAQNQNGTDPILAAIEVHRMAAAAIKPLLDTQSALERELPRDKRQSSIDAWEEKIIETDDPRWIDAERAVHNAFNAETDAAIYLLNVRPTTMPGLISLLQYAVAADIDGVSFPSDLMADDGKRARSWQQLLLENTAEVLPDMVAS